MNNQNKIWWTPEEVRKTFKCLVTCSIRFILISILSLLVIPILILPLLLSIALPFLFALLSIGLILELNFIAFSSIIQFFYTKFKCLNVSIICNDFIASSLSTHILRISPKQKSGECLCLFLFLYSLNSCIRNI